MGSATVRISDKARETLRTLAERSREPMQYILDQAIEEYRRNSFLREANQAYATLRSDEAAWNEEQAERRAWDATLSDHAAPMVKPGGKPRR
jgi:predicted transcriptional regulator